MTQAPIPAAEIELGKAEIDFVAQYGPRCRDCADRDGICSNGMPCGGTRKVAEYVIGALNYGWKHGFLAAPKGIMAEIEAGRAAAERVRELEAEVAKLKREAVALRARDAGWALENEEMKAEIADLTQPGRAQSAAQPAAERVIACISCGGTGQAFDGLIHMPCPDCNGTGRIRTTPPAAGAGETEGGR